MAAYSLNGVELSYEIVEPLKLSGIGPPLEGHEFFLEGHIAPAGSIYVDTSTTGVYVKGYSGVWVKLAAGPGWIKKPSDPEKWKADLPFVWQDKETQLPCGVIHEPEGWYAFAFASFTSGCQQLMTTPAAEDSRFISPFNQSLPRLAIRAKLKDLGLIPLDAPLWWGIGISFTGHLGEPTLEEVTAEAGYLAMQLSML